LLRRHLRDFVLIILLQVWLAWDLTLICLGNLL
jgi:hypothetical protein